MDNPPTPLPFLVVAGVCTLPFAISWAIARHRGAQPRSWDDLLRAAGCFVLGSGIGQLALAYAIAPELPPAWTPALLMASTVLAVIATGVAYALAAPDPFAPRPRENEQDRPPPA